MLCSITGTDGPCVVLRLLLMWCPMQPMIQPGVQLVVANFPHNPTGTMLQQQDWQQLVAACQAAGAWLFSDEMYRFSGVRMGGAGAWLGWGWGHLCALTGALRLAQLTGFLGWSSSWHLL